MINKKTQLLNILSAAVAHQSNKVSVRNIDNDVVHCLYKYGLITHIDKSNNMYKIYLNNERCGKIKLISYWRRHSRLYFRPVNITKLKLHMQESIYIFASPRGLVSQHELIKHNLGGVLAFVLLLK